MNILFITPSDKVGGGNRVMFELAVRISGGHQVTCVFPKSPGRPKYDIDPRLRTIGTGFSSDRRTSVLPNLLALYAWVAANKDRFDAIVSTGQITGILLPFIKHPRLYNFIQTDELAIFREGHLRARPLLFALYSRLMKRSLGYPGIRYIFNSAFSQTCLESLLRGRTFKRVIVHPGVTGSLFRPVFSLRDTTRVNVSSVVRKHPLKGLDVLLKAFMRLPSQTREKVRWHLVTNDDLSGFSVPDAFKIMRPRNDAELASVLQQSDIFLSTSLWEGFGLPALEAMACGCAVVTSRNGGCDEYAVDGQNCLTYSPKDHEALASLVSDLVADEKMRKQLVANGIRTARRFSWESSATDLVRMLEDTA